MTDILEGFLQYPLPCGLMAVARHRSAWGVFFKDKKQCCFNYTTCKKWLEPIANAPKALGEGGVLQTIKCKVQVVTN